MQEPTINAGDFHAVFDPNTHEYKIFDSEHTLVYGPVETHGEGVNGPGYKVTGGDTVPGNYVYGQVVWTLPSDSTANWYAYGKVYIYINDPNGNEAAYGRAGIGHHCGGTASPNPLADNQGFYPTLGCLRMLNEDMDVCAHKIESWQKEGHTIHLTILEWNY